MPLEEYRRKRDFEATPEPAPGPRKSEPAPSAPSGELRFVIHEHHARRLHYDLRLEIGGAYASWAVPKGPSLDPADKRLAVHVEDHPLEYGRFEGTIPAGEYGAGTVSIWDRGVFAPLGDPVAMLEAGQLKFVLSGSKLTGAFALVRMKPRPGDKGDEWLLIKERDGSARPGYDVLTAKPSAVAVSGASAASGQGAVSAPLPLDSPFQLATLSDEAPDGDEWLHEVKYDGYRLRIAIERGRARAITRNGHDWSDRFAPLVTAAGRLPISSALLDGEAVVFDADGRSDFGLLQTALSDRDAQRIAYVTFDLLYLDGFDLRAEPLLRRKELLEALLSSMPDQGPLRFAEHYSGEGPAFHAGTCEHLLEGSVSKRADRPWTAGRTPDWIKTKCLLAQEFVVGGFTEPAGSRTGFGALLLGVHSADGSLRHVGRVGTGFSQGVLDQLRVTLDALTTDDAPFADPPQADGVHWVRAELVVDVAFREWTRDGVLRQPTYRGLRDDADASAVVRETASALPRPAAAPRSAPATRRERPSPVDTGTVMISGVRITNPDKVLQPAGVTKRALATYYDSVAGAMLPGMSGRFLMAVRCPSGSGGSADCFHQKHPEPRGWPRPLHTRTVREKDGPQRYFHVSDVKGLLSLVQLGVAEVHAWNSLVERPGRPDRIVFDLDPGEGVDFQDVVTAAGLLRSALETLGLQGFPKTTGGHGLHVVVPIEVEHDFADMLPGVRALCEWLAAKAPDTFTAKAAKPARTGRVYLDYLRNARGATAVCAYSARARPGAPVSTPVSWEELVSGLDPMSLDIDTVPGRLDSRSGDPWEGYESARRELAPAVLLDLR